MGTTYRVKIVCTSRCLARVESWKADIEAILAKISRQMSTYEEGSEISGFNRSTGMLPYPVSREFFQVVQRSLHWSEQTGGAFDITVFPLLELWGFGPKDRFSRQRIVPPVDQIQSALSHVGFSKLSAVDGQLKKSDPLVCIDLGAIAKGYGVDAVSGYLLSQGLSRFLVEIGGEIRATGKNENNQLWRIGIQKPVRQSLSEATLEWIYELEDQAVATSGDYQSFLEVDGTLYSHEMDPKTGYPIRNTVASVTVVAANCADADALATGLIVLGADRGLQLVESLPGVEALFVLRKDSSGFRSQMSSGMRLLEVRPDPGRGDGPSQGH
jgi:thiamine biosynthesis lipoprotein